MNFVEMDPDDIRALLEAKDEKGNLLHQDVLAGELTKEQALFRHSSCPKCRSSSSESFVDVRAPFIQGVALPNRLLRCLRCRTEWNPYSGLITKVTSSEDESARR